MHPARPPQPAILTAAKAVALTVALALLAALAARLVVAFPGGWPWMLPGLLAGYAAADLFTGTVHWICDTFFSEETPLIGRRVIGPFRDHHTHPRSITKFRLLEQDGTNYIALLAPLWVVWRGGEPVLGGSIALFGQAALFGFATGAIGTNLFHKWAHADRVPPGVRWLQRHRLILSPQAHNIHHTGYTDAYCVTSGWMNALLDRVRFFERLERVIRTLMPRSAGERR